MIEPTQPKWPHLENFDKHPTFLNDSTWITVTEKVHGFNARFGRTPDGIFWIGSRNNVVSEGESTSYMSKPNNELQGFTAWALTRAKDVLPGYTFFGEWAGKGIQKGIDYGEKKFFLFGVSTYNKIDYDFLMWPELLAWSKAMACETVPLLYSGPWPSMKMDFDSLERMSIAQSSIAEEDREGICIMRWPTAFDKYGHPLIIKLKNPEFAERASKREKRPPADLTTVQPFVDEYATEERMNHVLDLVKESIRESAASDDPANPLDREYTGNVLREYFEDVKREAGEDWEKLGKDNQKLVGKTLNRTIIPMLSERRMDALQEASA